MTFILEYEPVGETAGCSADGLWLLEEVPDP